MWTVGEILGGKCFIDALLAHFYSKSFFMAGEWRGFISSQLEADKKLFFRNLDQLVSQTLVIGPKHCELENGNEQLG